MNPKQSLSEIRAAKSGEALLLSDLALRSKAFWGYSESFIVACRTELEVTPALLLSPDYHCFVAVDNEAILGFYATSMTDPEQREFELEALFVEPDCIGKGLGRALIQHAIAFLAARNARSLIIQGDPNARAFYLAAGAREIGQRPSGSIDGRMLPLFRITIAPDPATAETC